MKKLIAAIVILAWAGINTAHSQSDTSHQPIVVPDDAIAIDLEDDEVISGTDDLIYDNIKAQPHLQQKNSTSEAPYRSSQRPQAQRGHEVTPNARMHMRESNYSSVFCEVEALIGNDIALGANLTFMSYRWGMYGSFLNGLYSNWGSFGVAFRPFAEPSPIDFQLYTGPAFGIGFGYEFGCRFAEGSYSSNSAFSAFSGSIGYANVGGFTYMTFGISILLTVLYIL